MSNLNEGSINRIWFLSLPNLPISEIRILNHQNRSHLTCTIQVQYEKKTFMDVFYVVKEYFAIIYNICSKIHIIIYGTCSHGLLKINKTQSTISLNQFEDEQMKPIFNDYISMSSSKNTMPKWCHMVQSLGVASTLVWRHFSSVCLLVKWRIYYNTTWILIRIVTNWYKSAHFINKHHIYHSIWLGFVTIGISAVQILL